jgi:hypothetical protein
MAGLMSLATTSPPAPTASASSAAMSPVPEAQVQHARALAHAARADELALPQAMHAERHQVVHQVVSGRDRAEHLADQARLLVGRDRAEAEIGG